MRFTDQRPPFSGSTSSRPARSGAAIALSLGALLIALLVALLPAVPRADALGYSPQIDAPARYEGQVTCTSRVQPGTLALARYLLARYPGTKSNGLLRACGSGGRSEHKDGRAFDWGADVNKPMSKHMAYHFINTAIASDKWGRKAVLARRLGIMYIIYNDTIWSSYRDFAPKPYLNAACTKKATCSRSLRHLDHVHISLGYGGAAAQTSWYRQRNVTAKPAYYPRTIHVDPDNTAVTPAFKVPATGKLVTSPYVLRAGVTYRVVVTGYVRYGPGAAVGDANCSRAENGWAYVPTDRGPLPEPPPVEEPDPWGDGDWGGTWGGGTAGSDHPASPGALPVATTHGLILHKMLRWEGGCRLDHTYETWFTPKINQRLALRYVDENLSDNKGYFRVYVARDDITLASLIPK